MAQVLLNVLVAFGANFLVIALVALLIARFGEKFVGTIFERSKEKAVASFKGDIDKELQGLKAQADRTLETHKAELGIEGTRKGIVLNNQRQAFQECIVAMHEVVESYTGIDSYEDLPKGAYSKCRKIIYGNMLFIPEDAARIVELFDTALRWGVHDIDYDPDSDTVRRSHNYAAYIRDQLVEYFRIQVGVSSSTANPLIPVTYLAACVLLSGYQNSEEKFPTEGVALVDDRTPKQVVEEAMLHVEEVIKELERMVTFFDNNERSRQFHYVTATDARALRDKLKNYTK